MYYGQEIDFTLEEVLDYLRKSQSDDPTLTVEEVLATHEGILDRWTEANLGGKVPEHHKFREVVSGETMAARPELQRLLRLIESPKYKAVAVVEPQRLTRGDNEEIGRLMKLLKYTDTKVITPMRIYDLRNEFDWDAFERELKRGNDYLLYYQKIQRRGREASVVAGNFIGSIAPYGFDKTTVKDGKKNCPTLKENPEQATVVRMIFDMFVNKNMGRQKICNYLDNAGIKPPKGEHWSPETLYDLLRNVHYIGKVRWNWRKTITIVKDGEIINRRPKNRLGEYLVYDGKHDGIISEELFYAAQEKIGKSPRTKPNVKVRNPFAGLIFCKRCGRSIMYRPYNDRNQEPRMLCAGQKHCHTGGCKFDEIMDRVCSALEDCIKDFEVRVKYDTADSAKLHTQLIKSLEAKQKDIEKRELAMWEAQMHPNPAERVPAHIFKTLNENLLKEKEEVNNALCKAYESMPEPVNYEDRLYTFKNALEALRDPEVDPEDKNNYLKEIIERIDYDRDRPERIKREPGVSRRKAQFPSAGGRWTEPPITLEITLKP